MQAGYSEESAPAQAHRPQPRGPSAQRAGRHSPQPAGASERPSLLLQQRPDVDVPANGLPVKTAGEQVAHGVVPLQAEPHTIRRWPCNQAQRRPEQGLSRTIPPQPVRKGAVNWTSQRTPKGWGSCRETRGREHGWSSVQPNQRSGPFL